MKLIYVSYCKKMTYPVHIWILSCICIVLLYWHVSKDVEYSIVGGAFKVTSGIVGDAASQSLIATKVASRLDEFNIGSKSVTDAFAKGGDDLTESLSGMKSSLQKKLNDATDIKQKEVLESLIKQTDKIKTVKVGDKNYFLDMTEINLLSKSDLPVEAQNAFKVKAFDDMVAAKSSVDDAVMDYTRAINPEYASTSKAFVPRKALIDSMDDIMKASGKNLDDMSPEFKSYYNSLKKASWRSKAFSIGSIVTLGTFAVAIASILIGIFVKPSYMNDGGGAGGDRDPYSNDCPPGDINCIAMDWLDWIGENSTLFGLSSCMCCCCSLLMCSLMVVLMMGEEEEANYY
jgi:hypothetical protein